MSNEFEKLAQTPAEHAREIERLLGRVGHELRSPLAGLRAITEFLLEGGAQDPVQLQAFLKAMHAEVLRMSDLAQSLSEAARHESSLPHIDNITRAEEAA